MSNLLLSKSSNGRYLIDQSGNPFLVMGDSPQGLITAISVSDATGYINNRAARGFNSLWVNLLCIKNIGSGPNGETYDDIHPFTVDDDLSTPNSAYFARADSIIQAAYNAGIVVFLNPCETISWLSVLRSNGLTKARNYGKYLGSRYGNFDNIVWQNGNDFNSWEDADDDALVRAVALGIRDNETRHIHTVQLEVPVSSSIDDSSWSSIINLCASYTYYATYAEVRRAYSLASIPVYMVEANYEYESLMVPYCNAYVCRKQEYWTMTSGATGHLYGNHYLYPFPTGWESYLDSPGGLQMVHLKNLFAPRRWHELVPDVDHSVMTAGYGTYSDTDHVDVNTFATAARTPDGKLIIAYIPVIRQVTIDMTKLSGASTGRWYDPSNGAWYTISGSPFPNTGTRNFTASGNNSDGDEDWVLVLEMDEQPNSMNFRKTIFCA